MTKHATELLKKVLTHRASLPPALTARIEAYVNGRYVTDDRILLGCKDAFSDPGDPRTLPGFQVTEHSNEHGSWGTYFWPEAGDPRLYDGWGDGIVVPICGRLWRVRLLTSGETEEYPMAASRQVLFEQVDPDTAETEYTAWDPVTAATLQLNLAEKSVARRAEIIRKASEDGDVSEGAHMLRYALEDLPWAQQRVDRIRKDHAAGDILRPTQYLQIFGQPDFIQNECFPQDNGRPGMCLAVIYSDHGDCGNENLMFSVDAQGIPSAVWHEASSH